MRNALLSLLLLSLLPTLAFANGDTPPPPAPSPAEAAATSPPSAAEEAVTAQRRNAAVAETLQPDPAARLPKGNDASELFEIAAILEDGGMLLGRILITNAGPSDRNAVATGHWIEADGTLHSFDNVRRRDEWKISRDRRRLDIGSTHLDLKGPLARYSIDKKRIQLDLQLDLRARANLSQELTKGGQRVELLAGPAPAVGSIKLAGWAEPRPLRGQAVLIRSWSAKARAERSTTLFGHGEGRNVLALAQGRSGAADAGWALVSGGPEGPLLLSDLRVETSGRLPGDRGSKSYPAPRSFALSGAGANLTAKLGKVIAERDLLGAFPQPLRSIVKWSLNQRPHRVWARLAIEGTLPAGSGGAPHRFQAVGGASIVFTDAFNN